MGSEMCIRDRPTFNKTWRRRDTQAMSERTRLREMEKRELKMVVPLRPKLFSCLIIQQPAVFLDLWSLSDDASPTECQGLIMSINFTASEETLEKRYSPALRRKETSAERGSYRLYSTISSRGTSLARRCRSSCCY